MIFTPTSRVIWALNIYAGAWVATFWADVLTN